MAQQTPPSPDAETNDVLNMPSQYYQAVALMATQRSLPTAATVRPFDPPFAVVPGFPEIQPALHMMPMSPPDVVTTRPYHGARQNNTKVAHSQVAASQFSRPSQNGDRHSESGVEAPHASEEQGAEAPQETEILDADAETAEPQREISGDLSDLDLSDGPESCGSSESEEHLDRLDRYAFSCTGQGYDHQVPQHLTSGITLFAKKLTQGTPIVAHLNMAERNNKGNMLPSLVPHELEMKRTPKAVECIWVGMLPNPRSSHKHAASASAQPEPQVDAAEAQSDDTPKASNKAQKKAKKIQAVVDLEYDQLIVTPHNPNALRVVAKKLNKAFKIWHLYALATSGDNSELCEGWKVNFEEVFFFKAFRDDTAAGLKKRRTATELKIRAVILPADDGPAEGSQSSTPVKRSTSCVSATAAPTPSGLPRPGPSDRKGKAVQVVCDTVEKEASIEDKLDQDGDDSGGAAGSVEDGNGPDAYQHEAVADPGNLDVTHSTTEQSKPTGTNYENGEDNAYPEHAVSPTSTTYQDFLDDMLREFCVKPGEKRKRVAFDPSCDEAASTRRKTCDSSGSSADAQDGSEGDGSASFVVQRHTGHLVTKLKCMIEKLAAKQDVAGLRQCISMVESIEKRGAPGPESALAPYLNVTSKKDASRRACDGKLREILVSLPADLSFLSLFLCVLKGTNPLNSCRISFPALRTSTWTATSWGGWSLASISPASRSTSASLRPVSNHSVSSTSRSLEIRPTIRPQ